MVIFSLLGVIGLIFLVYFGTRWINKKFRSTSWNSLDDGIKIIDCLGIAQDKQLLVIKAGKKGMLLGVSTNSITKICDIDDDDIEEMQRGLAEKTDTPFSDIFRKAFSKNNSEKTDADASEREDGKKDNEFDDF